MTNLLGSAESVFRLIVDEAKEYAIFLIDKDGKIETWNAGAERIFGRAESEVVGQDFAILFTEEDRARGVPAKELEAARDTGRGEDTRWHVRGDGEVFFSDGVTMPV